MDMTLERAIAQCDRLRPGNKYGLAEKVEWISQLEGRICEDVLKKHEGYGELTFDGYDENTPDGTALLMQGVHSDVYSKYLIMQIDHYNNESARYANSMSMFASAWEDLVGYVTRNHMPIQTAQIKRLI